MAPAHADGLSKFNELIKPKIQPPDSLTYKSAKALGDNGFELDDVVFTPPPDATAGSKAEPIKIKSVVVDEADFDQIAKEAPPNFIKMRVQGIDIAQKPAKGIDLKALAGIDKASADFQLDYRVDPAKKTMTVNRIEFDLNGLARLELTMVLDNITVDMNAPADKAMNDATLRTASLVYDDHSLLAKSLPAAAKSMSMDEPGAMIMLAKTFLDALRAGQGEATQNAFDGLESYMEDYKAPKGPLRVTLSPPGKVTAAVLTNAKGADDVIEALGLKVDYAGTRKMAPTPAAGGGGAAAKDAAKDAKGATKDEDDDATKDVTKGK
ncbi:MAG TPA: hypothetical protein VGG57_19410 [Stellaceae bacterium]|jgi:hypothetical protein